MTIGHHVIFKSIKFHMQTWLGGSTHITMPNFLEAALSISDILRFFKFSKYICCGRHLGFLKLQNFIGYLGVEGRDASACQISSKLVVQLWRQRIFKFSKCPPPPSWIFKVAKFYLLFGRRRSRRINTQNFVKIGKSVVKVLRFFVFSRWRPPPSWIVDFAKF